MDLYNTGMAWVGNIANQFEALCLEMDDYISQEPFTFVENQLNAMSASAKEFYSEVIQDTLSHPLAVEEGLCPVAPRMVDENAGDYSGQDHNEAAKKTPSLVPGADNWILSRLEVSVEENTGKESGISSNVSKLISNTDLDAVEFNDDGLTISMKEMNGVGSSLVPNADNRISEKAEICVEENTTQEKDLMSHESEVITSRVEDTVMLSSTRKGQYLDSETSFATQDTAFYLINYSTEEVMCNPVNELARDDNVLALCSSSLRNSAVDDTELTLDGTGSLEQHEAYVVVSRMDSHHNTFELKKESPESKGSLRTAKTGTSKNCNKSEVFAEDDQRMIQIQSSDRMKGEKGDFTSTLSLVGKDREERIPKDQRDEKKRISSENLNAGSDKLRGKCSPSAGSGLSDSETCGYSEWVII